MRINLVTGATYAPARISPRPNVDIEPKTDKTGARKIPNKLSSPSLDNLSTLEMGALEKLFGQIKSDAKQTPKSNQPGQFVDITI
jgi:hypothetical protein